MKLPFISSLAAGNHHLIMMFLSLPIIVAASSVEEMIGSRELDQTPTWAVSLVCGVIIIISLLLEKTIYLVGKTFSDRKKFALLEALEKIKAELMVVGFISLTLTFGQKYITSICIPEKIGDTMLPCELRRRGHHGPHVGHHHHQHGQEHQRRLLWYEHRVLAADSVSRQCERGYVPLISSNGLHQLHIFIFFLAVFHVLSSAITMRLRRVKIREWKAWEKECEAEYDKNDSTSYRFARDTSFVKGHAAASWMTNNILFYIGCFFRPMVWSVRRADYWTLRHGFISVHLAPGIRFNFQKYVKRSLEDDFKVVIGVPPLLWFAAMFYLLMNVEGSLALFWLSIMPLLIILAVGTKLQAIISRMAIEIQERHAVVQGIPLMQVSDNHFWFNWPELMLHLIHLTLFQNAFEITYFFWITYEYGLHSCFHHYFRLALLRVFIGVAVNIMCSYITLPLYALVTQMGSHMKRGIFDDQTSKALKLWHKKVRKNRERSIHMLGSDSASTQQQDEPHRQSI
ncbi:MLO-like protein 9 [Salvia hispanica]|uniref:MLO-like protein 9 n=1 Tax=Salvia hispanica TaxID=49212 RepID=UPI00200985F9|nr:MLO-like protein 9 [Salvia hispanica]